MTFGFWGPDVVDVDAKFLSGIGQEAGQEHVGVRDEFHQDSSA
jgi:hypothetical protein